MASFGYEVLSLDVILSLENDMNPSPYNYNDSTELSKAMIAAIVVMALLVPVGIACMIRNLRAFNRRASSNIESGIEMQEEANREAKSPKRTQQVERYDPVGFDVTGPRSAGQNQV